MNKTDSTGTIRALRFHEYGEPLDVLRVDEIECPEPGPGHIRVVVHACALNPADWALCRGFSPGNLPRGIGLDVAGLVVAVGEGVGGVGVGDAVMGTADFAGYPAAGIADQAVLDHWAKMPEGLDYESAAALVLVTVTAYSHLEALGVGAGNTLLVHGGGSMVGYAAVQIALMKGARVITTAGDTYAERLRTMGAEVTPYGDGMVERVAALAGQLVDFALDASPALGALPDLIRMAGGDAKRVMTITDHGAAPGLGVRSTFTDVSELRYDVIDEFARYAVEGKYHIPVIGTYTFDDWRAAAAVSLSGHPHGKLVLLPVLGE